MKIVRRCPRCRAHLYHWVNHPNDGDETPLHRRSPESIPARVEIECGACAHRWQGRLHPHERGTDDAIPA